MTDDASRCSGGRANVLRRLGQLISAAQLQHPTRVAIDGRTASGKTTFADELAARLRDNGRHVIRTSVDGFHRPRSERYARGRFSPEGYYYDARDVPAIRRLLLDPLGETGDRRYRTASFDLHADRAVEYPPIEAAVNAILVVDGTFLQRPDLRNGWDLTIFLQTSPDVAERRGIARDSISASESPAFVRELYARRYQPAYTMYENECRPLLLADAVVDNDNLDYLSLTVRSDGRFASVPNRTKEAPILGA